MSIRPVRSLSHSCCSAADRHFSDAYVEEALQRTERDGPFHTTTTILETLRSFNLSGCTLLEIGGGVGTVSMELMAAGLFQATQVEASRAYLEAAKTLARKKGRLHRVDFVEGDFAHIAPTIALANVVVLDRVVCCYPDMEDLLKSAASRCRCLLALSYPKDHWVSRLDNAVKNRRRAVRGDSFMSFVHSEQRMNEIVSDSGFVRVAEKSTVMWRTALYRRVRPVEGVECSLADINQHAG